MSSAAAGTPLAHPVELLVVNAGRLVTARTAPGGARGHALDDLETIPGGAVAVADGRVADVGPTETLRPRYREAAIVDAEGRLVTPGFVDSHVHLAHGGSRHEEYDRRIRGVPPPEGAATGIPATIAHTAATPDEELRQRALADLDVMLAHGTTTSEAKTGYGGDADGELRLLRLSAGLTHPITLVPTFLGAHALPPERADDRDAFVDAVIGAFPAAREHARFFDVFIDPLGFTREESHRLLTAAVAAGFDLKVHADQTADVGGTALAVEHGATSVDHLDHADADAIAALVAADTVGVLLPGVAHHLGELTPDPTGHVTKPHLPEQVRRLVTAGARLALSTDYNPGTSPTRSMQTVLELAVRLFRLSAAAAWHMATINGAHALGVADERGSLEPGKAADLVVWDAEHPAAVTNRFGTNLVAEVLKDGRRVVTGGRVMR
ncbi:imidazolonepropionase [Egibacter rhizosphaerae]|uniref:Imidazolonepropionase n=1 Tax=Egibacter rhizosphaerae TaxID=1670831 RepID=A0A411YAW3_9ACTN|nr:imidazolonepropionase [Egibacter rhizosphaerae]QBI18318.1 imidazolonepropionase [Egibacter rhizosphaerae]